MSCFSNVIIPLKVGSTFEETLTLLDENDVPVNISGWVVESDLKKSADDVVVLSFDVDDSLFVSGVVNISASAAQTELLPVGDNLLFDVKLTEPDGKVRYTETMQIKTCKHITD